MKLFRLLALIAATALVPATHLIAQSYLVNDTFSDEDRIGGLSGSSTSSTSPSISTPTATNTQWVANRNSQLVATTTGMTWNFDTTSSVVALGRFPDVTVGAEEITFRLSFTTGTLGGTANNLRVALLNAEPDGFRLTDSFSSADAIFANDAGYGLFSSGSTVAGPSTSALVFNFVKRLPPHNDLLGAAAAWSATNPALAATTGSTGYIQPNTTYVLEFKATYVDDALTLTVSLTGGNLVGTTVTYTDDSASAVNVFNVIAVRWGGGSNQLSGLRFNSFTVTTPAPVPPAITSQPADVSATVGDNVSFTVAATGDAPLSYQWKVNGDDLVNGGNISGANSATLSITGVQIAQAGSYTVTVSNAAGNVTSDAATLTVAAAPEPPVITTPPASQTIQEGENATFTVVATGTAPLSYQWQKGGVDLVNEAGHIAGATTDTLTITDAVLGDAGSYTVIVSNVVTSVTSAAATLTVDAIVAPSITVPPASQTVEVGESVTFSVTATGTAPLSYQWLKDDEPITGATASTYTIAAAQLGDAGNYTVRVSNAAPVSALSAAAALVVNPASTPPPAPVALDATGVRRNGFTANWETTDGAIDYQLQVSTAPDFSNLVAGYAALPTGNVTSVFVAGLNPQTTYFYRVRADNGLLSAYSNTITVTTSAGLGAQILDERFTASALNNGLVLDANNFLTPELDQGAWAGFGGTPSYTRNTSISMTAGNRGFMAYYADSQHPVELAVGDTLSARVVFSFSGSATSNPENFRLGLLYSGGGATNVAGASSRYSGTGNSLTSNGAARGYSGFFVASQASPTGANNAIGFWRRVPSATASQQIVGPTSGTIPESGTFVRIAPNGGGAAGAVLLDNTLRYTAVYSVRLVSETTAELSYTVYRDGQVVMTHAETYTGTPETRYDALMIFSTYGGPAIYEVEIEKIPRLPVIVTQPADAVALIGESRSLSVVAQGEGSLAYRWQFQGADLANGANVFGADSATLTLTDLQLNQSGAYSVVVTNPNGSITSSAAELLVITEPVAPVITTQPTAEVTVDEGDEVKLTVAATGIPAPRFQWQRNGVDVVNEPGRISGATSATLTINPSRAADSGNYTVVVSNMAATLTSATSVVTVVPPTPPTITAQPQSLSVTTGGSATFSVTADGTAPITYQWQFNGVDIPGATSSSYTIPQARDFHAGNYTVVLSNIAATVTSDAATLTPLAPTAIPATPVATAATTYWEGDFTANWNPASGADGFRLDVATNSTFTAFVPGFQNRDVGAALSRLVPNLAPNTTYYYRVRAYNSHGTSGSSNVITVTTAPSMQNIDRDIALAGMTWLSTRPTENPVTTNPADGTVSFRMQGTSAPTFIGFLPQAINLQVGQRLTMTLTFETGATVNALTSNSFRMGLFNSNGTRLATSTNIGDSDPSFRNDQGYMVSMNFDGTAPTLHGRRAFESDNNLLGTTTDLWTPSLVDAALTSGTTGAFAPWTTYTISVSIARQADRTVVSTLLQGGANNNYFISGVDSVSGSLNNAAYDQFAMRINGSSNAVSQLIFTDLHFAVETFEQPSAPRVSTHPASRTIFEGQTTTFTATVTGAAPMTFRWLKNGLPLTDGGRFSGVNTASLTLTGAVKADEGAYTLEITNALGSQVSDPAVLTVDEAQAPAITTGPANRTVTEGEAASFTVAHSGTAPFTYQWSLNGTPLTDNARFSGTAEATLNVVAAALAEAGTYSVTVTNVKGNANASATLAVNAAASAPAAPVATAATGVQAGRMTANWNRSASATGYLLEVSTDADFTTLISGAPIDAEAANSWTLTGLQSDTRYYYRVRAYNSVGVSDYSATISTLVQRNDPPLILSPAATTFTAGIPSSFRVRVEGAPAPTITATGLPAWAELHPSTGLLLGTAPVGTSGVFTFQITAANGNPPSANQTFSLTVSPIPDITAALTIGTRAGTGGQAGAVNATGAAARFRGPLAVVADAAGNAYVADADNHAIRKITPAGVVTTFAGEMGSAGSADGTGADARFNAPTSLAIDAQGNLYVADTLNHTIRKITSAGVVTTIAGTAEQSGFANGIGAAARFNGPQGVALSGTTTLYVADTNNHVVRQIALSNNNVTTLAGAAGQSGAADGSAANARFSGPTGIAVAGNVVYVTDIDSHTIRAVSANGEVRTVAGYPEATAAADGIGANARFRQPSGLVASSDGSTLYITDTENNTIRRFIVGSRAVTTGAGRAGASGTADGVGATARFNGPAGIGLGANGNLLIADTENHTVRAATLPIAPRITQEPQTITVAAGGSATFTVVAEGTPAPTYQWFLNGKPISGATSSTYSISNVNAEAHGGAYTVVVSNTLRSETSQQAYLIIPIAPTTSSSTGSGGGGGGAPSTWFLAALAALAVARGLFPRKSN